MTDFDRDTIKVHCYNQSGLSGLLLAATFKACSNPIGMVWFSDDEQLHRLDYWVLC